MTIFAIIIWIIVILGTLGFAEEEFWSSCLKLVVVVMFILIGIVCICGGGPAGGDYDSYLGGANWQDPGAFANGFKGVCAVFVTAALLDLPPPRLPTLELLYPEPSSRLSGESPSSTSLPLLSSVSLSPTTTPDYSMVPVPMSLLSSSLWRRLGSEV
jgi:hypothetical protein